ncbi:MAG TPA: LuxR C-terminal-related transcriptional regulator, partial [Candidatus Angelobacter sp.]|nr:LuxR C-terminal-related transcriptional regulator [Candidatus Angelobacter sp.]
NRDIAEQMETTEQVVKNSIRSIFDKIGVSDRLELALFVLHHRMLAHATAAVRIDPDPPRPKRSPSGGNWRRRLGDPAEA